MLILRTVKKSFIYALLAAAVAIALTLFTPEAEAALSVQNITELRNALAGKPIKPLSALEALTYVPDPDIVIGSSFSVGAGNELLIEGNYHITVKSGVTLTVSGGNLIVTENGGSAGINIEPGAVLDIRDGNVLISGGDRADVLVGGTLNILNKAALTADSGSIKADSGRISLGDTGALTVENAGKLNIEARGTLSMGGASTLSVKTPGNSLKGVMQMNGEAKAELRNLRDTGLLIDGGALSVNDSASFSVINAAGGTGLEQQSGSISVSGAGVVQINNNASFILKGGIVKIAGSGQLSTGLKVFGTMSMSGGRLELLGKPGVNTVMSVPGTLDISDGTVIVQNEGDRSTGINAAGSITVSGGAVTMRNTGKNSKGIAVKGNMLVSGGLVEIANAGDSSSGIELQSKLDVTGGSIHVKNSGARSNGVDVLSYSEMNVTGGSVYLEHSGEGSSGLAIARGLTADSKLTVTAEGGVVVSNDRDAVVSDPAAIVGELAAGGAPAVPAGIFEPKEGETAPDIEDTDSSGETDGSNETGTPGKPGTPGDTGGAVDSLPDIGALPPDAMPPRGVGIIWVLQFLLWLSETV